VSAESEGGVIRLVFQQVRNVQTHIPPVTCTGISCAARSKRPKRSSHRSNGRIEKHRSNIFIPNGTRRRREGKAELNSMVLCEMSDTERLNYGMHELTVVFESLEFQASRCYHSASSVSPEDSNNNGVDAGYSNFLSDEAQATL
jgi:hypothetical protein